MNNINEVWEDYKELKIKSFIRLGVPAYTIYHVYPNGKFLNIRAMEGYCDLSTATTKAKLYIDNFKDRIEQKIEKWSKTKKYAAS